QHIKRDKATSNICTAQVLLAVMAGMYAVYHGPKGLKFIDNKVHNIAATVANALTQMGYKQSNTSFFDTSKIDTDTAKIKALAEAREVNFFYPDANTVTISFNQTTSLNDANEIIAIFAEAAQKQPLQLSSLTEGNFISNDLQRQTSFLTLDVFNSHHSETE